MKPNLLSLKRDRWPLLLSLLSLLGIFATAKPLPLRAQIQQPALGGLPAQKIYAGFDSEPEQCDTSLARGWFYWYMDAVGQCYIVPMPNPEEANRQAFELIDNSFYVVASGYGLRDSAGNPLQNLPFIEGLSPVE